MQMVLSVVKYHQLVNV